MPAGVTFNTALTGHTPPRPYVQGVSVGTEERVRSGREATDIVKEAGKIVSCKWPSFRIMGKEYVHFINH